MRTLKENDMKEIINTIGTLVTIVALVMAIVLGGTIVKVLSGLGIIYVMYFHDEYLKSVWQNEAHEKDEKEVEE